MKNADDVSEVDVLLAECHLVAGDPAQALELVATISAANPTRLPALERTRGRALAALGDELGARLALESSLTGARDQEALYEIALTLDVLVTLDLRSGDVASAEAREAEHAVLLGRLGIQVETDPTIDLTVDRASELPTAAGPRT
jgi:hypothetical protein